MAVAPSDLEELHMQVEGWVGGIEKDSSEEPKRINDRRGVTGIGWPFPVNRAGTACKVVQVARGTQIWTLG